MTHAHSLDQQRLAAIRAYVDSGVSPEDAAWSVLGSPQLGFTLWAETGRPTRMKLLRALSRLIRRADPDGSAAVIRAGRELLADPQLGALQVCTEVLEGEFDDELGAAERSVQLKAAQIVLAATARDDADDPGNATFADVRLRLRAKNSKARDRAP